MSYLGVHVHYISVSFVDEKRYYTQVICLSAKLKENSHIHFHIPLALHSNVVLVSSLIKGTHFNRFDRIINKTLFNHLYLYVMTWKLSLDPKCGGSEKSRRVVEIVGSI